MCCLGPRVSACHCSGQLAASWAQPPLALLPTSQGLLHHELHDDGFDSSAAPPGVVGSDLTCACGQESSAWGTGSGHRPT